MLGAVAAGGVIALVITVIFMGTGLGKALYPVVERFPKCAAFLSGAMIGALFGLIPGATLGWMAGSRITGVIVCALCAAGAGYAWMRFETRVAKPETKAR